MVKAVTLVEAATRLDVSRDQVYHWAHFGCRWLDGRKLRTLGRLKVDRRSLLALSSADISRIETEIASAKARAARGRETIAEAARRTGAPYDHIKHLARMGKVKAWLVHRRWEVSAADLDRRLAWEDLVPAGMIDWRDALRRFHFLTLQRLHRWSSPVMNHPLRGKGKKNYGVCPPLGKRALTREHYWLRDSHGGLCSRPHAVLAELEEVAKALRRDWGIAVDENGTVWMTAARLAEEHGTRFWRFNGVLLANLKRCLPKGETIRESRKVVPVKYRGSIVYASRRVLEQRQVDKAMIARKQYGDKLTTHLSSHDERNQWIVEQRSKGVTLDEISAQLAKRRGWRPLTKSGCFAAHREFLKRKKAADKTPAPAVPQSGQMAPENIRVPVARPATPAQSQPHDGEAERPFVSANEPRDRWMYDQRCKSPPVAWKAIWCEVNRKAPQRRWEPLGDPAACRLAVRRLVQRSGWRRRHQESAVGRRPENRTRHRSHKIEHVIFP